MSMKSCMEYQAMCYSPEGSSSIQYSRGIAHFVCHLHSYLFFGVLEAAAGWTGVWMGHSWVLRARGAGSPRIRSSLHSRGDKWNHTGKEYFDNCWWLCYRHAVSRHCENGESRLELYKSAVPQIDKLAWKQWLDKVQRQGEGIDI